MRWRTIAISAVLHGALFALLLWLGHTRVARPPTAITMIAAPPKKATPAEPPPKSTAKQPPRTVVASRREIVAPTPKSVVPPAEPAHAATGTPIDSGMTFGNSEHGVDVGGGNGKGSGKGGATPGGEKRNKPAPSPQERVLAPKGETTEEACTEAPTKPSIVDKQTAIEYTTQARSDGIEGRLVLRVFIAADGSVERVEVVESVDPNLDAAAIAAVQTWRFQPALRCGKPVGGGVYTIARRFELGD